jgi:prepilin-type processing-associated H-X9-DG protein/prepilin-type N-terminal cleavage/methylation domain-containing protein
MSENTFAAAARRAPSKTSAGPGPAEGFALRTGGFTLMELLVVVGIIAVLVAVVMPVLGRAREHADRVVCAANLRSIGQALTMYVQQSRFYPAYASRGEPIRYTETLFVIWPTRLRPFLSGVQEVFNCPSQDPENYWRRTDRGDPVPSGRIPARGMPLRFGYETDEWLLQDHRVRSCYGYNGFGYTLAGDDDPIERQRGLGSYVSTIGDARFRELRASRVKVASEMIAAADTGRRSRSFVIESRSGFGGAAPTPTHRGGANVLFCDGHVQWHLVREITSDQWLPPERIRRLWNNDNQP